MNVRHQRLRSRLIIESKRTIEIDEFVPKKEIDELYLNSPYYLVPDGEVVLLVQGFFWS